jgi:hypothetical protein
MKKIYPRRRKTVSVVFEYQSGRCCIERCKEALGDKRLIAG